MRPGQSCPGVDVHLVPVRGDESASMRPGQSCPGVGREPGRIDGRIVLSFNEAGAIMPRSGTSGDVRVVDDNELLQ